MLEDVCLIGREIVAVGALNKGIVVVEQVLFVLRGVRTGDKVANLAATLHRQIQPLVQSTSRDQKDSHCMLLLGIWSYHSLQATLTGVKCPWPFTLF